MVTVPPVPEKEVTPVSPPKCDLKAERARALAQQRALEEEAAAAVRREQEQERQRRAQELALKARKRREQESLKRKNLEKRDHAARCIQRYWIRHRIEQIRKRQEKVREYLHAVTVIQHGWRKYLDRTNGRRRNKENFSLVAEMRDMRKFGSAKHREREIAALTIQLAFRRFLRRKYQNMPPPSYMNDKEPWSPSELAKLQRERVEKIYGTPHTLVEQYEPNLKNALFIRPTFQALHESAAVKSFNFAFREYHPNHTMFHPVHDGLVRPIWDSAVTHLSTFSAIFRRNEENYEDSRKAESFQKCTMEVGVV